MSDDFEDLLGGEPKPDPKKPVRPLRSLRRTNTKQKIDPDASKEKPLADDDLPLVGEFLRPVGTKFLAQVFGKQPYQIEKRLTKCPIVGTQKVAGQDKPLYDFTTALAYLIEPKGNIEEWFASKNAATLPPYVNKMFWDSAHQRNRVMRSSGDLWHTEDVMTALGRVALTIKEETQLWIENLPNRDMLTDEQYTALTKEVYRLQDIIRERMIEMPEHYKTHAMSHTIQDELVDAGTLPEQQGERS